MAIDPKSLSVDYKQLLKVPVRDRIVAAQSNVDLLGALTPTQRAQLFPRYYEEQLPDVSGFTKAMSGGLNRFSSKAGGTNRATGESSTYGPANRRDKSVNFTARYVSPMEKRLRKEHPELFMGDDAGIDGLENRQKTIKSVYDSFRQAGFSRNQSLALTAEVGRENGFREKFMFGEHTDAANAKTNLGMLSMQGSRRDELYAWLAKDGLLDENGNVKPGQDSMNSMAKFYRHEMETTENTKATQAFLDNPDISREEAAEILGRGYIRWDMDGKHIYVPDHIRNREMSYNEAEEIVTQYSIDHPKSTEIPDDIKLADDVKYLQKWVDSQPNPKVWINAINTHAKLEGGLEQLQTDFNTFVAETSTDRVDEAQSKIAAVRKKPITPELKEVLQMAAENAGVEVEVFSGGQNDITEGGNRTGTTRHDDGHAADIKLKVKNPDGSYRYLSSSNDADREIMAKFISESRKMGAEGIGHSKGYMGDQGIHVGTVRRKDIDYSTKEYGEPAGAEATWLSEPWVIDAVNNGKKAALEYDHVKAREERIARLQAAQVEPTENVTDVSNRSSELIPAKHPFSNAPEKKAKILTDAAATAQPILASTEPSAGDEVPTLNQGGNVGENATVIDDRTGEVLAKSNHRENLIVQPKYRPEDKLEQERVEKQTPTTEPLSVEPKPEEPVPTNKAAMTQGQTSTKMAPDAYSGLNHGTLSPSQLRAYRDRGENLHREATSYV